MGPALLRMTPVLPHLPPPQTRLLRTRAQHRLADQLSIPYTSQRERVWIGRRPLEPEILLVFLLLSQLLLIFSPESFPRISESDVG